MYTGSICTSIYDTKQLVNVKKHKIDSFLRYDKNVTTKTLWIQHTAPIVQISVYDLKD